MRRAQWDPVDIHRGHGGQREIETARWKAGLKAEPTGIRDFGLLFWSEMRSDCALVAALETRDNIIRRVRKTRKRERKRRGAAGRPLASPGV